MQSLQPFSKRIWRELVTLLTTTKSAFHHNGDDHHRPSHHLRGRGHPYPYVLCLNMFECLNHFLPAGNIC